MEIGEEEAPIELPLPTLPEEVPDQEPSEIEPAEVQRELVDLGSVPA
jgi:hypothetical protein